MSDEAIESPPVVPAMTADAGPLERGTCKADLTALEQAFRAGYAEADNDAGSPQSLAYRMDTAWTTFLADELKGFSA